MKDYFNITVSYFMIAHVIEYKVLITSTNFAFRRTTSFIFIKVKNKKLHMFQHNKDVFLSSKTACITRENGRY